jgi:MFS transporter, UMF1 family
MDRSRDDQARRGWLAALALDRPELRAWILYDWAVSGWQTAILTALFPIYYHEVAGAGLPGVAATARFAAAMALSVAAVAIAAQVLGAIANRIAARKAMLGACLGAGVLATAGMALIHRGDLALATGLFVVAYIGASGSLVFHDALLPHVARPEEVDRVSTIGHALGYLGGGILLALDLAWLAWSGWIAHSPGDSDSEAPVRLVFLSVAAWWLAFSIPLFLQVPEPAANPRAREGPARGALAVAMARLRELGSELLRHRQAALLLVAFLTYQAGVETIQKMAAIFGKDVGLSNFGLLTTILLVQFVGIPFAVLFGMLADRIGAKPSILIALAAYSAACVLGFFLTSLTQFVLVALLVTMVRGGCQALSRSLFARLVPARESAAFFGLFAVAEKVAGAVGPGLFASVVVTTGSSHQAVGALIVFFLVGAGVLSRVDVGRGTLRLIEPDPR